MNLLPTEEKEILKQKLKSRSLSVIFILLASAFLIGMIMLVPSYFLARGNLLKISSDSITLSQRDQSTEEILNLPNEIEEKTNLLEDINNKNSSVDLITKIIQVLPQTIKLDLISMNRDVSFNDKKGTLITISGKANNRDILVAFADNLKKNNNFSEVDLPVSSLTKETNLSFSIKLFSEK